MPNIPRILQDQQVAGPAPQQQASLEDFTPGWRQVDSAIRTSGAAQHEVYAEAVRADKEIADLGENIQKVQDQSQKIARIAKLHRSKADATTAIEQYAFNLKNGTANADGSVTPPPDPSQHVGLYKKFLDGVGEQYGKELDPASLAVFKNDISQVALRQGLEIQKDVIEKNRSQSKANLGYTLDTLGQAASSATALQRPPILDMGRVAIQDQVATGNINAEEARTLLNHFVKTVSTADLRRGLGTEDLVNKLRTGPIPGLNPDEQERWLNTAVTAWNTTMTKSLAQQEHAERMKDKQDAKDKESNYGNRVVEEQEGKLIPATITDDIRNKRITPEKGEALFHRLTKGDPVKDDPITAFDLDKRANKITSAAQLDDFIEAAGSAYTTGRTITWETFKQLEAKARGNVDAPKYPDWSRQGEAFIVSQIGGQRTVDPFIQAKQGQAVNDFQKWAREHPKATDDEATKVYKRIADSGRTLASSTVDLLPPQFAVKKGDRLDLLATQAATQRAFQKNDIGLQELKRQMSQIRIWGERQALMDVQKATSGSTEQ